MSTPHPPHPAPAPPPHLRTASATPFHYVPVVQTLTSSFGLESIPTKKAEAPASSMTRGGVLLEAMAMLRANLAKVKSMEDK